MPKRFPLTSAALAGVLAWGVIVLTPIAQAQEATSTTTVQGANQGSSQGTNQGSENGGPTLESLGLTPDENGEYDTSVLGADDPRQGANQGVSQGTATGATTVSASNENTGADSTNSSAVDVSGTTSTSTTNTSAVTNAATGTANTGNNTASENTGNASVSTGNASIGVQQFTADNLNTAGSTWEISHSVSAGSSTGDLVLTFDPSATGEGGTDSFRSTNTVTGSGSDNTATVTSTREELVEIQNDGTIISELSAAAITGHNDASQNTGNAAIDTGNANIAATLLNFLNANIVDGALWLEVLDIFGDLQGNIIIPEEVLSYLGRRQRELGITATNAETGSESTNTVDVDVTKAEETTITNTADVENVVAVDAVTGQNSATQNTGHATIETGDVDVTANTVTLANLNVVDGSLGLIIVNALNRWLGFLLGSDGSWTPIDHEFTTIEAANRTTGPDSANSASVDVTETETTTIQNDARIVNGVNLAAITGENTANQNTGTSTIRTGDARVAATVVNVVNTNVVRGGFFVNVINIFGEWLGNLFFGSRPVSALAASGSAGSGGNGGSLDVRAENAQTGADSENTIAVDVSSGSTLAVENSATIENILEVDADTGHNEANRNTGLGSVDTGDAVVVQHARNIANVTVAGIGSTWGEITAELTNATTGAESTNTIDVTVNDERQVTVSNDATVDTALSAAANTGFNSASRNTLGGRIATGDAAIDALIENLLNATWLLGGAGADPRFRFDLANEQTGSDSTNSASVTPTVSTDVDLTNSADVTAAVDALATSGGNAANRNTGGGSVGAGDAGIGGDLDTAVNQTVLKGGMGGSLDLDVTNEATVENDVVAVASSGENEANRNTGTLSPAAAAGGPPSRNGSGGSPLPASAGDAAAASGPNEEESAFLSGVGGGPTTAVAALSGGRISEEAAGPHYRSGHRRAAAKPRRETRSVRGDSVSGRTWSPATWQVLAVSEARAAEPLAVLAAAPSPANRAVRTDRPPERDWSRVWPWVFLTSALGIGIGSSRSARTFLLRLIARR